MLFWGVLPVSRFAAKAVIQAIRPAPLCDEKVEFAWRMAVGPAAARATTVRLDTGGVLHVKASDQHWHREMRRSAAIIQSRLHAVLGDDAVKQIRVNS